MIEKFGPNGELLEKGSRIKGYKEHGSSSELFEEEVHGLAVGVHGSLYVYNEEDVVEYTNEAVNKFNALISSEVGEPRHGIAVDANRILYLAHESEEPGATENDEPATVIARAMIFGAGEEQVAEPLIPELTPRESTGVAVDAANNDAMVDNVPDERRRVRADRGTGRTRRTFRRRAHTHGRGVAATRGGDVLVADAGSNQIDYFAAVS